MNYAEFHQRSIEDKAAFWGEQARLIDWHKTPEQVLDFSNPPFARWFVDGELNLSHNCIDRHLAERAEQNAIVWLSTEINRALLAEKPAVQAAFDDLGARIIVEDGCVKRHISYREFHQEVNYFADVLQRLGVDRGDRVVIYMPMIAEALFAMLACARLGAIHSVVFGGFAAHNLAMRIDDAQPKVLITADAGMRGGKVVPYKHLVDSAVEQAEFKPEHVLVVNRGLDAAMPQQAWDADYATMRHNSVDRQASVPCAWMKSTAPSYILYTSGTTGKPKGVQRDIGGYAVALAASMNHIYDCRPGEVFWSTSDIGWVVGHSYIVYAPLLHGMTTIVYEGLPTNPDPGIWWRTIAEYRVTALFSSPTGARILKKQDPAWMDKYDLSSLQYFFLAGEPLDEPTASWLADNLDAAIVDNYWQTETGWPLLSYLPGVDLKPLRYGSPGMPVYGYDVTIRNEATGEPCQPNEKGLLTVQPPLPPGCLATVWGDDKRFISSYFSEFDGSYYSTSDWAVQDEDGYYFILGRTDDVINVAGHRLGTREIEEAICGHPLVAEVAVVGKADELKGQVPIAFCTLKDNSAMDSADKRAALEKEVFAEVVKQLGAVARPAEVYFTLTLPKTRSGKLLRRSIQAVAEGRDPGDLSTLDDPNALAGIQEIMRG